MFICLQFSLSNYVNWHGWQLKALGYSEECSHPEHHCRRLSSFIYFAQILERKYEALKVPLSLLIGFKQFLLHTSEQWIPSVHQAASDIRAWIHTADLQNFPIFGEAVGWLQQLQIQTLSLLIAEARDKMNPLMLKVWAGTKYILVSWNIQA